MNPAALLAAAAGRAMRRPPSLHLVVIAVLAGSALLGGVAVATSVLLGVVAVAPPWSWSWPGLAASAVVASVLSVALHRQASPPPRAARTQSHRSAARPEPDTGGPR